MIEGRGLTGNPQITRESHLETTSKGGTIYGSDGRERKFLETTERAPEVDKELVDLRLGHRLPFDQVRS